MSDVARDGWEKLLGQLDEPAPGTVAAAARGGRHE